MLYPELFKQLESVRWDMDKDIPWASRSTPRKLSDEQAQTIKMNAITEWSALPATEMFLRDNRDDSDFSAFMSIWFFEEQKHSLVLMEYLQALPPRAGADRAGAARGALRVRPGAGARDADAALLRRDPPQPLVPPRRRMAHRAGHQAHLHDAQPGRGAPRRRLPALHEARASTSSATRPGGLRQGRRADGQRAPHRAGAAPDQPARQQGAVPARHHPEPPAQPRVAGALARQADQVRRRLGRQGRRAHPAQPEPADGPQLQDACRNSTATARKSPSASPPRPSSPPAMPPARSLPEGRA